MRRLFTSESVTEGHPDKMCDQISDSILDALLVQDPNSRVACETADTTGLVMVIGEITTNAYVDIQKVVRQTVKEIGYDRAKYGFDFETCAVINAIDEQSADIAMGVDEALEHKEGTMKDEVEAVGAGDQGMMFGFACDETPEFMPLPISLAHKLAQRLSDVRKDKTLDYLRPDGKTQVTVEYEDDKPVRIDTIVISTQHNPEVTREQIEKDLIENVIKPIVDSKLLDENTKYLINPTGRFVIGGPQGDSGLTGRKIIVDTYGGKGAHGGGAFSGKVLSNVDRSAAYATRHIAKNLVAAGVADEVLVQVSYAIGVAEPCGLYINTYGTSKLDINDGELAKRVQKLFDLRPYAVEKNLKLRNPIYLETAAYGHMGKDYYVADKTFNKGHKNELTLKDLEFFTWEKLDRVDDVKKEFGL